MITYYPQIPDTKEKISFDMITAINDQPYWMNAWYKAISIYTSI